jgi:hypothetical protein
MGINLELPQESSMQSQHGMANSGLSTIGASNGFAVQQPGQAKLVAPVCLQRLVMLPEIRFLQHLAD